MRRLCLLAAWLCALSGVAEAQGLQEIMVDDDPGDAVVRHIESAFAHHAEAASGWYIDAVRGHDVTYEQYWTFAARYLTGTFAEFEYRFTRDGATETRVYHAASGPAQPRIGIPGVEARGPVSAYADPGDLAVLADVVFEPGSPVTPSPVDDGRPPNARIRDAELRVAQTLESDILRGLVPAGGQLTGFVSQRMCDSCRRALEQLSSTYAVDITITALAHGSSAYARFHARRRHYMRTVHRAVLRWARPTSASGQGMCAVPHRSQRSSGS